MIRSEQIRSLPTGADLFTSNQTRQDRTRPWLTTTDLIRPDQTGTDRIGPDHIPTNQFSCLYLVRNHILLPHRHISPKVSYCAAHVIMCYIWTLRKPEGRHEKHPKKALAPHLPHHRIPRTYAPCPARSTLQPHRTKPIRSFRPRSKPHPI